MAINKKNKDEARALKAANKPTRASKNPDIAKTKRLAEVNKSLNMVEPHATRNAAQTVDAINNMRNSGGIAGKSAKNVNPIYRMIGRGGGGGIGGAFGIKNK